MTIDKIVNAVWAEETYHYVIIVTRGVVNLDYQVEPTNPEPHKCEGMF